MQFRSAIIVSAALMLSGCATTFGDVTPTATDTTIAQASDFASSAATVQEVSAVPAAAVPLGAVESITCQAHSFDPIPTDDLAVAALKAKAAQIGARYVSGVSLAKRNVDVEHNCWWTIDASGQAYR